MSTNNMHFSNLKEIALLRAEYIKSSQLQVHQKYQSQAKVIKQLCEMQIPSAFQAINTLIPQEIHHEGMNDFIPDTLMDSWKPNYSNPSVARSLEKGLFHSQNEIMRHNCLKKLVDARYGNAYPTLVDFRNHLIRYENQKLPYWPRLFNAVIDGLIKLESCYDKTTLDVSHKQLRLRKYVYLEVEKFI